MNHPVYAPANSKVTTQPMQMHHISGMENCENCSIIFDMPRPGHGRVTLIYFQTAWTAFWAHLSDGDTPEARFMREPVEELVRSFQYGTPKIAYSDRYKEAGYLHHLIDQVRIQLAESGALSPKG